MLMYAHYHYKRDLASVLLGLCFSMGGTGLSAETLQKVPLEFLV